MSGPRATILKGKLSEFLRDEMVRRIASGSLWSLFIKLVSAVLTFGMLAALARAMSIEDFGKFGFAFSMASFLAVAANPGLYTAVLRWIPEYEAKGQEDLGRQALRWSTVVATGCGAAMTALIVIVVSILPDEGGENYLYAAAAFVLPFLLAEYLGSILRAKGSVFWAQLPRDVVWRILVLGLAFAYLLTGRSPTASEALWLVTACLIIALIPQTFRIWPLHRRIGEAPWPSRSLAHSLRSQLLPYWAPSTIYAGAQYVDTVLVGVFVSTDEAGAYFAAARIAALASLMLAATNMISAPLIARSYHGNDHGGLKRTLRIVALCISVPTAIVVIGIAGGGTWLLSIFDPRYVSAYPVLVVLLAGHAINGLCGPGSYLLSMTGHGNDGVRIIAISYAVGLAVQIVLVQLIGPIGAAIGGACAMASWSLASRAVAIRKLGVDPSITALFKSNVGRRNS